MTALTDKRILGIRSGDQVIWPADGVGPDHAVPTSAPSSWRSARPAPSSRGPGCPNRRRSTRSTGRSRSRSSASTGRPTGSLTRSTPARPTRWPIGDAASRRAGGAPAGRHRRHRLLRAGENPEVDGDDAGPKESVELMDYNASITYVNPVSPTLDRTVDASAEDRLLGPGVPDVRAGVRRRPRPVPDRRHDLHRGDTTSTCRRPARSRTSSSSPRCSTRARPRPSRSPGSSC